MLYAEQLRAGLIVWLISRYLRQLSLFTYLSSPNTPSIHEIQMYSWERELGHTFCKMRGYLKSVYSEVRLPPSSYCGGEVQVRDGAKVALVGSPPGALWGVCGPSSLLSLSSGEASRPSLCVSFCLCSQNWNSAQSGGWCRAKHVEPRK